MGARMVCGDAHAHVLLPFLFPAHCRAQYTAAIYLGFQAGHCPGSVSPSCSRLHLRPPVPVAQTVPAERGRLDLLFVGNVLILSALVLSHLLPVVALIVITPSLFLLHRNFRAAGYAVAVFSLAFFITAFWGLPFLDKLPWTAHMAWNQLDS